MFRVGSGTSLISSSNFVNDDPSSWQPPSSSPSDVSNGENLWRTAPLATVRRPPATLVHQSPLHGLSYPGRPGLEVLLIIQTTRSAGDRSSTASQPNKAIKSRATSGRLMCLAPGSPGIRPTSQVWAWILNPSPMGGRCGCGCYARRSVQGCCPCIADPESADLPNLPPKLSTPVRQPWLSSSRIGTVGFQASIPWTLGLTLRKASQTPITPHCEWC